MDAVTYKYKTSKNLIRSNYDGCTQCLEIEDKLVAISMIGTLQNFPNYYHIKGDFSSNFVNQILKEIDFDFYSEKKIVYERCLHFEKLLAYFELGSFYVEGSSGYHDFYPDCILDAPYHFHLGSFDTQMADINCTKEKTRLSPGLIEKYKAEIKNGLRPMAIAYRKDYGRGSETGESFVLDGHHKLMAYSELEIEPKICTIINNADQYDPVNQKMCPYLNHLGLKEVLHHHYITTNDKEGNLQHLKI